MGVVTDEFQFFRGLRHGDPLSPFLFILVVESLQVAFIRVINRVHLLIQILIFVFLISFMRMMLTLWVSRRSQMFIPLFEFSNVSF